MPYLSQYFSISLVILDVVWISSYLYAQFLNNVGGSDMLRLKSLAFVGGKKCNFCVKTGMQLFFPGKMTRFHCTIVVYLYLFSSLLKSAC